MFRINTKTAFAALTLLSTAALPLTGSAASYLEGDGLYFPRGQLTQYTASLSDMTQNELHRDTRTLDWRQPSVELFFDLPASERTSEIVLTLSADPLGRVANMPLEIQFNNGAPVPILSRGNGFEAKIPFDAAKARPRRNSIRISFPTPPGADCVTPNHGQWSIDLAQSNLQVKGRTRTRNMSLAEVEARLSQPALAPKRVGLIARGASATQMQALAAQGIGLRTDHLPKFSVTTQNTDFNVIMATRKDLFKYTDDPMVINSKGPRVFVPKGRPTQLIFTADTQGEIVETLKSFSTRHLPAARRAITSHGEIQMQSRLGGDLVRIDRHAKLTELATGESYTNFGAENWTSGLQNYRFAVSDPAATKGELLLRLSATDQVADTSRLRVALNGDVLGAAKLDRRRKSVAFDIRPGQLNATGNILTLLPELDAKPGYSCPTPSQGRPNFTIGDGSRLKLTAAAPSPVTELSRLAATGGVFSETESYIALPRQTRDYQAALRVVAQLARSAGHGLTDATYSRKAEMTNDQHVLVIGPAKTQMAVLGANFGVTAPKALRDAMSGARITGLNLRNAALERFASAGSDDFAVQYAAAQTAPRNLRNSGVAAMYDGGNGHVIGVISATPGESFTRAADRMVEPLHWNAIGGGVARWDGKSVLMAQTAQPVKGYVAPTEPRKFSLPTIDLPDLSLPEFTVPEFNLPNVDWPEFDMPTVSLPSFNLPKFKRDDVVKVAEAPVLPEPKSVKSAPAVETKPMVKVADVSVPRLKPEPLKLRGAFQFDKPSNAKRQRSFKDIQIATKEKYRDMKRWTFAKWDSVTEARSLKDISTATDRLQDRVKPAGKSIRRTIGGDWPGKKVLSVGDRTFTVFGLMLFLAFGLVVLLMSLAGPNSRLGGRH